MRKKPKFKQKFRTPLSAHLNIIAENAAAFETWREGLPGGHGPGVSEWVFPVEVAKGIKAEIRIPVPGWDEYRSVAKEETWFLAPSRSEICC